MQKRAHWQHLGEQADRWRRRPQAPRQLCHHLATNFFSSPATIRHARALILMSDMNTWQLGGGTMHREGAPQFLRTMLVPGLLVTLIAVIELAKATV
jgi:hypothetical protein